MMVRSIMKVTKAMMHEAMASKMGTMPDFWKANMRDSGLPRYEGGRMREATVRTARRAATRGREREGQRRLERW